MVNTKSALKTLKTKFLNHLFTMGDRVPHKHNIFWQSQNSFNYVTGDLFLFVLSHWVEVVRPYF